MLQAVASEQDRTRQSETRCRPRPVQGGAFAGKAGLVPVVSGEEIVIVQTTRLVMPHRRHMTYETGLFMRMLGLVDEAALIGTRGAAPDQGVQVADQPRSCRDSQQIGRPRFYAAPKQIVVEVPEFMAGECTLSPPPLPGGLMQGGEAGHEFMGLIPACRRFDLDGAACGIPAPRTIDLLAGVGGDRVEAIHAVPSQCGEVAPRRHSRDRYGDDAVAPGRRQIDRADPGQYDHAPRTERCVHQCGEPRIPRLRAILYHQRPVMLDEHRIGCGIAGFTEVPARTGPSPLAVQHADGDAAASIHDLQRQRIVEPCVKAATQPSPALEYRATGLRFDLPPVITETFGIRDRAEPGGQPGYDIHKMVRLSLVRSGHPCHRVIVFELPKAAMFPDLLPNPRPVALREFRRIATVLIDTEEDFDWTDPTEGTDYATAYLSRIAELQPIFAAHGVVPTYLVTYPVLLNPDIVGLLIHYRDRGEAALGIQLHPWVTPPFEGRGSTAQSFGGNLAPEIEARKLESLCSRFIEVFASSPLVFRAGRYGLGRQTAALIEAAGILVDTSIAPRTSMRDEAGPDYSRIDFAPFWFGAQRSLLELPLGRAIVGWGGALGDRLYRALIGTNGAWAPLAGLLARIECAERITLSPEGNDPRAVRRLVQGLGRRDQMILPLSFHSSSIAPGRNPYVRSRADLHRFYDDLSAILCDLTDEFSCRFAAAETIPALLCPAPAIR